MFPARVIVTAWKDIVATELNANEPPMPIRNATAVGKAAKPYESARSPCGIPRQGLSAGPVDTVPLIYHP